MLTWGQPVSSRAAQTSALPLLTMDSVGENCASSRTAYKLAASLRHLRTLGALLLCAILAVLCNGVTDDRADYTILR